MSIYIIHTKQLSHSISKTRYTGNMKFLTILGRQPEIGVAELERLHGGNSVSWLSQDSAIVETDNFDFNRLGGSQKAGQIIAELGPANWHRVSQQIVRHYSTEWSKVDHKITLGISTYGFDNLAAREVQKTGIILKQKLKSTGTSLRLLPNQETALSSATSHHNKLGLSPNKVELLVVRASNGSVLIAESVGAQNITALATRDQGRPKRDAFVGMLPPKLAKIMINLSVGESVTKPATILDPFCGTGVLLQEARLLGYNAYGSDLSDKMVDYTAANLKWLDEKFNVSSTSYHVEQGDAMSHQWQPIIDVVASEAYLGQPFSAPPSTAKLTEVRGNCDYIIRGFLKNIAKQIKPNTPLCLAVPAWKDTEGKFTHLPLINDLDSLGYKQVELSNIQSSQLIYHRDDQVVARQLLVLTKT